VEKNESFEVVDVKELSDGLAQNFNMMLNTTVENDLAAMLDKELAEKVRSTAFGTFFSINYFDSRLHRYSSIAVNDPIACHDTFNMRHLSFLYIDTFNYRDV